MAYTNLNRPGTRTSTNIDPKNVYEDIDYRMQVLEPWAYPLQELGKIVGRGSRPKSHKIQVTQYHAFDNLDYCSSATLGTVANGTERLARLTVDQISRPQVQGSMYYYPQDKIYIVATGQVVEVVMNPVATIEIAGGNFTVNDASLMGVAGAQSTTAAGTILVRSVEPIPVKSFTTSDIVYMGRTIWESQPIQAYSKIRDFVWDCNFLEHKEAVLEMSDDQKNIVTTNNGIPDYNFQQRETFKEFKGDVETTAYFSEREIEILQNGRAKRHMRGLIHTIRTNRAFYNPATITDFEDMYSSFLYQQAYGYKVGSMKKVGLCGGMFLYNFNKAFREYRRTSTIDAKGIGKSAGLNIEKYMIPGGYELGVMRNDIFRMNTPMEHWCVVIDPSLMEWRIAKDYASRPYKADSDRDFKIMIEWQGTIAWHLEQAHSMLTPF